MAESKSCHNARHRVKRKRGCRHSRAAGVSLHKKGGHIQHNRKCQQIIHKNEKRNQIDGFSHRFFLSCIGNYVLRRRLRKEECHYNSNDQECMSPEYQLPSSFTCPGQNASQYLQNNSSGIHKQCSVAQKICLFLPLVQADDQSVS